MQRQKFIYLSGLGFWMNRLFNPDEFRGVENWKVTLYPDPKSWQTFKAEGLQNKIKEDDNGKFISLKRPVLKPWKVRPGENPEFDPPAVRDADGKLWPEDGPLIGNGSAITVKLEVYQTRLGKGTRIQEVRIDNLIEYVNQAAAEAEATDNIRPF